MKYNDNNNIWSSMRHFESKCVKDSAVTITVAMIMSALCHNNIQDIVTKYKSDINPTAQFPRSTPWVILILAIL